MGEAYNTHGEDKKRIQNFGRKNKGGDHAQDLGEDGRLIVKLILQKQGGRLWNGFIWLRIGTIAGLL
jgi:hypothetical protein